MRITRIRIEGWRSIKSIDFYASDITIFVGSNNAGKTNIMSAINFVLGDRYPMPGNLQDMDFYGVGPDRRVKIIIDIEHHLYSCISFDITRQYSLQAYDRRGGVVRGFNNAMREDVAFAYVDASRNFEKHFGLSRWSLFGQCIRQLHNGLRQQPGAALDQLREALTQAHGLLRTDLYEQFEGHLRDAFAAQLRTARYDVRFEFRTIDETNLYRSLFPILIEAGNPRNPGEVGSGVRNLLVLALFQAFARSFRGGAVLGIEEPELYLHPHAQRSLMKQFEELITAGNQVFISSHSASFLDITRSERIVLVERCEDDEEEICTQVRTTSLQNLLELRRELHPDRNITEASLRAFLRNMRMPEMTEPYFSHVAVIVEGPSEREALPIFAKHLGLDFDEFGISIVSANGKTAIDTLFHIYAAHHIRTYVIFDNDIGRRAEDRAYNRVLCRMLGIRETDAPVAVVDGDYAIIDGNWEAQCSADLLVGGAVYTGLVTEACEALGIERDRNKPLIARFIAQRLIQEGIVPEFIDNIITEIRAKLPDGVVLSE